MTNDTAHGSAQGGHGVLDVAAGWLIVLAAWRLRAVRSRRGGRLPEIGVGRA